MVTDFIKRINAHYSKNLPLVVYRKPNALEVVALFQKDDRLHYVVNFTESGFIFAPFDTSKEIVLLRCDERMSILSDSLETSQNEEIEIRVDASQKEFHTNLVKKGVECIRDSNLQKVVLSRKIEVDCFSNPLNLLQKLLGRYDNAFCYFWHHPKIGTWLGATPEILMKGENLKITTMSLAGTQKYVGEDNPNWGVKELEEQQLVTNYISGSLKDMVTNLVVSERETIRAGELLHLRTKLTANYENYRLSEIVKALHPTPAVCGLPMASSKKFIQENENYDRGYYTGYLGELNLKVETPRSSQRKNHENQAYKTVKTITTLFVNLRCMQLKENKAIIYIGGGVTKDSDPDREWEETVAKTNTILRILNE